MLDTADVVRDDDLTPIYTTRVPSMGSGGTCTMPGGAIDPALAVANLLGWVLWENLTRSNSMISTSPPPATLVFLTVDSLNEKAFDALPYGVIQLDAHGTIIRYNAFESGLSGLRKEEVLGKNFFKQIAPCTDVKEFYGRFREGLDAGKLHCTFRYHFAFKQRQRDVTVTLLYVEHYKITSVLVQPIESRTPKNR